ncbi:MarR family winged helix-turn-helix transcriptional regulator [Streptomyces sp. NPDC048419]|uniref:MarR family winged helix-turn-helix transcriptional regulator n=1 Tax=Streptomyces sp. NPDC048419 TaxID=3365547 RepID=UPI003719A50B
MQTSRRQLPGLLGDARRWFDDALLAALTAQEAQPVSSTHLQLFSVLDDDGTTVSELARRMAVTRQTAHQAVHTLVAAGLLEQVPHPTSQRQRLIRRTAEGRKAHTRAEEILTDLEHTLAERIGAETVAQLRSVLEQPWGRPPEPQRPGE